MDGSPLSTGFSRQEYWSELPCPPPGDLPDPGIQPISLTSPALAGGFSTTSATGKAQSVSHSVMSNFCNPKDSSPLSMRISRQDYWSGLPFPSPGDLPDPGMEPVSPASPALAGGFFATESPGKPKMLVAQLCPSFWDPTDCSPPGSSVHGILQAGILEWVSIPFWRGSSQPRDWTQVSWIAGRLPSEPPGKLVPAQILCPVLMLF